MQAKQYSSDIIKFYCIQTQENIKLKNEQRANYLSPFIFGIIGGTAQITNTQHNLYLFYATLISYNYTTLHTFEATTIQANVKLAIESTSSRATSILNSRSCISHEI